MATMAGERPVDAEARFFFRMAVIMALVNFSGFASNAVLGRSSFVASPVLHFHALTMMTWMGIYVSQTWLVMVGNVSAHRRLGRLAVAVLALVAISGVLVTRHSLQVAGGPSFFAQNHFLFSNSLHLTTTVVMVLVAVRLRKRTDWHRRLMMCTFAMLTGPGIGRLLPMPLLIPYAWWIGSILVPLIWVAIGLLADRRRTGAVHPAWLWGAGSFLAMQVLADLIAYSALGISATQWLIEGTPGAERGMGAFVPAM